uniref:Uncharacterized protein n=1 Tax=Canis lupus familiaris TaxID=9615 RepID=A0A8C0N3S5_CANLF
VPPARPPPCFGWQRRWHVCLFAHPLGPLSPSFRSLLTPVFPPCPSLAPGRQLVLPGCPPPAPPSLAWAPPSARPASCPSPGRYTYEIAPVFVLMEEEVLKKLRALVGWSSGDGVFCPGGSISNMYAEPGPLSALPGLQAEGPAGPAAPGTLHVEGGGRRLSLPRLLTLLSGH